ncbi:MAG: CPBP family intramembrane metalloprotease [Ruminococcus sp.]|nr:CPBP family intramembrane metalloprotease [Ruminococcus sp.]
MKRSKNTLEDREIVNAIDELDSSTQNEHYNTLFKRWRRSKDNPYAFRFEMNKKESVYIDGRGFVNKSAAEAEHTALSSIMNVVGIAMLMWIVSEKFFSKAMVFVLSLLGVNVHTTLYDSALYGGTTEIVAALIAINLVTILTPTIYMHRKFGMPGAVETMRTMNDQRGLLSAIAMTFIVCTVTSIPSAYTSDTREIYSFFRSVNADVSVWTQKDFIVYVVFDIIVVSVLSEILFRGAVFGALRQFGDVFAICVTSLVAGLLTQDFSEMPVMILISAVAGWGMLASGTIFTAFSVHIIYKLYQLAMAMIEDDSATSMMINRSFFMAILFAVGALILVIQYIVSKHIIRRRLAAYHSDVSVPERLWFTVRTFPFFAVAMICIISAVIRVVY